jgi:hypothetical protein
MTRQKARLDWQAILATAVAIVHGYDTGVTLRQLFYRLVAAESLPNTRVAYSTLSHVTARARRDRTFPALIDRTRAVHRYTSFDSPGEATDWLCQIYRRERTEGQSVSIYLGVEKAGIVEQLKSWFGDYGIPILALGGYSSQTYIDGVIEDVKRQGRDAVLIYAGDFDPSGEDIDRDFLARTDVFSEVVRVALNADQVGQYNLPEQMGKTSDSRARGFVERHGRLVQVELDALPPDVLRELFQSAIDRHWDTSEYERALCLEESERAMLRGAQ